MKAGARALSASGRSLSADLQLIIRLYESRFGKVPPWMLDELTPLCAAALLDVAVRVGIPYCVKDLDLMAQHQGDQNMTVRDRRNKPLPDGHPLKGATIVFGQKRPDSAAASRADLLKPPARERFETQYEYEDAIAVWRERVARIRAMEARAKAAGFDPDERGETK